MKKQFLLFALFLFLATNLSAQAPLIDRPDEGYSSEKFSDRLYFGGGFGMQFGNETFIEIAPIVGYRATERLAVGLGFKYQYHKYDPDYIDYSSSVYGGGPFAQFVVYEGLFAHAEVEVLSIEVPDYYFLTFRRQEITSVFLGGGYRQMMGSTSTIDLLILWNINETTYSPYMNPIFRVGFGFGF